MQPRQPSTAQAEEKVPEGDHRKNTPEGRRQQQATWLHLSLPRAHRFFEPLCSYDQIDRQTF
jgi:hypothetical protein